jgi:branched-subunit amino acid aminotransferase/4-amino-4-deoxychorismate lyase
MILTINKKPIKEELSSTIEEIAKGYGVFETLRTYEKKTFQLKEHIDRLFESAKKIKIKIKYKKSEIKKMTENIIAKSKFKNQKIKIIAVKKTIIIISKKLKIDKKIYKGVKAMTLECERTMPEIKSTSYIQSIICHEEAQKKGYFEAILTKNSEIYEGAFSNIFWFEKDVLCTRKKDVLQGITRRTIIQLSPYKTKFKKIKINELKKKKEIFITNSLKGIVPIINIDKTKIGDGRAGEKTKELMKRFNSFVFSNS